MAAAALLIRERLDRVTVTELLRLAEAKEARAVRAGDRASAERWYETAEWLRDLHALAK